MGKIKRLEEIEGPAIIVSCVVGPKEYTPANRRFNDFVNKELTKYNKRRARKSKEYQTEAA